MRIADGLDLLPGEDGILPVRLRWVALVDTPEAFSVDDERVYVAGSELIAFNLGDGSIAWQYDEDDEALESDGSVVLRGADVAEHGRIIANVGSGLSGAWTWGAPQPLALTPNRSRLGHGAEMKMHLLLQGAVAATVLASDRTCR